MSIWEHRFWAKVDKSGDCWLWIASRSPHGYGRFRLDGKIELAHRVSYELAAGAIPEGMVIDHVCHVVACVKPAHLRMCTQKQNQEHRAPARSGNRLRGANFNITRGRWEARARHNRRTHTSGYYDTALEAAEVAKQMRLSLYTHNDLDRNPE